MITVTNDQIDSVEQVDITPDRSLLPKSGRANYSFPEIMAEFIDNSIDSYSDSDLSDLRVDIFVASELSQIQFVDNAAGMDKTMFINALKLAKSTKVYRLGQFGLGMKAACAAMGRRWEIATFPADLSCGYRTIIDMQDWEVGGNDWFTEIETIKKPEGMSHGTIITVKDLIRAKPNSAGLKSAMKELALRYSPFIRDSRVKIFINKKLCKPQPYDLIEKSKVDINLRDSQGNKITGWVALMKAGSNRGYYGFHLFRLERLISMYDKMAIGSHPTISRIIGEIHLNHVPVTSDKREFEKNSPEYVAAEKVLKLSDVIKKLKQSATEKAGADKLDPKTVARKEIWKNALSQAAKKVVPLGLSDTKRDKEGAERDEQEIEQRNTDDVNRQLENNPIIQNIRKRNPHKTHARRIPIIKIAGKNYVVLHDYLALGEAEGWKSHHYSSEKGIEIYTNTNYPAYYSTEDVAFYAAIHIAEAVGEIVAEELGEDLNKAREYMLNILREASLIIQELKKEK